MSDPERWAKISMQSIIYWPVIAELVFHLCVLISSWRLARNSNFGCVSWMSAIAAFLLIGGIVSRIMFTPYYAFSYVIDSESIRRAIFILEPIFRILGYLVYSICIGIATRRCNIAKSNLGV